LFVDNPVGAGYSYVDDPEAYTRDVAEITSDLIVVLRAVLERAPEFAVRSDPILYSSVYLPVIVFLIT